MRNWISFLLPKKQAIEPVEIPFINKTPLRLKPVSPLLGGGDIEGDVIANRHVTEHFRLEELVCPCCERIRITPGFYIHMELLERLRRDYGEPIMVNSGYRCPDHNKEIGGTENSWHMRFATDLGETDEDKRRELYKIALSLNFGGIGLYTWGIHLDMRPEPYRWRA